MAGVSFQQSKIDQMHQTLGERGPAGPGCVQQWRLSARRAAMHKRQYAKRPGARRYLDNQIYVHKV